MKTLLDVNGIAYYGGKMATAQSSGPQLVPYDSSHSGSQNRLSTLSPTTASESISNPVSSNAPMGRRLGGEPSESLQTGHMQAVVADETFRYGFVPTTETHPTQAPMAQIPSANNGTVDVVLTSHDEKEIAEKIHKGPWFDKCSLSDRDGMALAFIAA